MLQTYFFPFTCTLKCTQCVKFCLLVYNVGAYRRKAAGTDRLHDFFRHDNEEAQEIRRFAA